MSRGHGWVQRRCLAVVGRKPVSSLEVAAAVFELSEDQLTQAQTRSVYRALRKLEAEGRIVSKGRMGWNWREHWVRG